MATHEEAQAKAQATVEAYKEAALANCRKGYHGSGNYGFGSHGQGMVPAFHFMTLWCNACAMSFECKSFDTPQAEIHADKYAKKGE